jgi:hypothetical protein
LINSPPGEMPADGVGTGARRYMSQTRSPLVSRFTPAT